MQNKLINVYLIAGQSNAVGFGIDYDGYLSNFDMRAKNGYENVLYYGSQERWDNKKLNISFQPLKFGMGANFDRCGPELGIAKTLGDNQEMTAIIKCAWGATHLYPDTINEISFTQGTWTPPTYIKNKNIDLEKNKMIGRMYSWWEETVTNALDLLIKNGYTPVIKGIWWMQGEAEMYSKEMSSKYEELLRTLISDMRNTLNNITGYNCDTIPFIFGLPSISDTAANYIEDVRDSMKKVANDPNVVNTDWIDCISLNKPYDHWHFDGLGQVYLGESFIEKIKKYS